VENDNGQDEDADAVHQESQRDEDGLRNTLLKKIIEQHLKDYDLHKLNYSEQFSVGVSVLSQVLLDLAEQDGMATAVRIRQLLVAEFNAVDLTKYVEDNMQIH
jgi:hypothetical protein